MRRGKRTLTQALGALVLLSSLIGFSATTTAAQGIDSLTLDPETATVAPGDTLAITVDISGTAGEEYGTFDLGVRDKSDELNVLSITCDECVDSGGGEVNFDFDTGETYTVEATINIGVSDDATDGQTLSLTVYTDDADDDLDVNKVATFTVSTDTDTGTAPATTTATATGTVPATTTATATATGTAPATTTGTAPATTTATATATATATGTPPDATDTDEDGTPDASDNCPAIANTDQADANDNGIGDACESAVTLDISSNFPSFAGTLPAGTTWVLVQDNTVVASATLTDADVALPASLPLGDGVQFGDYTLTIFAGSDFSNYSADVTFDEAAETVDVELSSSLVDDLVDVLIQILEDILNG